MTTFDDYKFAGKCLPSGSVLINCSIIICKCVLTVLLLVNMNTGYEHGAICNSHTFSMRYVSTRCVPLRGFW